MFNAKDKIYYLNYRNLTLTHFYGKEAEEWPRERAPFKPKKEGHQRPSLNKNKSYESPKKPSQPVCKNAHV